MPLGSYMVMVEGVGTIGSLDLLLARHAAMAPARSSARATNSPTTRAAHRSHRRKFPDVTTNQYNQTTCLSDSYRTGNSTDSPPVQPNAGTLRLDIHRLSSHVRK